MLSPTVQETCRAGGARRNATTTQMLARRRNNHGAERASEHLLEPATLGDHLDRLFRAAWALSGSRDEAEDLVQETFARILARPRIVRDGGDLAYLLGALRNTFISQRRDAARRPTSARVELETLSLADPRSGPNAPLTAIETDEVLAAVAELPAEFREALVAIDVAGLSYREAAELAGVGEGTITSRLYRARARVAKAFADS
jgi:RNA polymerase sigma-70 factor (ECF subfamily)